MSGSVGIVNSVTGSVVQAPVSPVISSSAAASSVPTVFFHNPRLIQDPAAGLITEYLSANGSQVVSQTPSAITVAYLRNGLTADGAQKHQTTTA